MCTEEGRDKEISIPIGSGEKRGILEAAIVENHNGHEGKMAAARTCSTIDCDYLARTTESE